MSRFVRFVYNFTIVLLLLSLWFQLWLDHEIFLCVLIDFAGVPLPYLIRPRREVLTFDTLGFYNDYLEYSTNMGTKLSSLFWLTLNHVHKLWCNSNVYLYNFLLEEIDNENAEDDSSMKAVETTSLDKGNCFGLGNESNASLSEIGN